MHLPGVAKHCCLAARMQVQYTRRVIHFTINTFPAVLFIVMPLNLLPCKVLLWCVTHCLAFVISSSVDGFIHQWSPVPGSERCRKNIPGTGSSLSFYYLRFDDIPALDHHTHGVPTRPLLCGFPRQNGFSWARPEYRAYLGDNKGFLVSEQGPANLVLVPERKA